MNYTVHYTLEGLADEAERAAQGVGENDEQPRETKEVAAASGLARFLFLKTTFAVLFTLLLLAGGAMAYLNLVKESFPDLDIPQATITTGWPGADPQTIEEQVTQELEDEILTLKGLKSVQSASFDSFSVIAVEFSASADSKEAMQRLRDAVSDAEAALPEDAEAPDIVQVSVDDRPIMTVTLYGQADDTTLNALAKRIQDRLETIAGINEADLGGGRDEIIQILLAPNRLQSLGISPPQVSQAIRNANLEQPFGEIESEEIGAVVRLEGQFRTVDELRRIPVMRLKEGGTERTVRLGELGTVRRRLEREESRAFFSENGDPFGKTIEVSLKKVPGADTVNLVAAVRAELEELKAGGTWPEGVSYSVTQDEGEQIWDSLAGVFENGVQSMVAVFLILLVILTWREGLIAGLSIPVSFAGAMVAMWLLGYTLNELVIIGMVLALGLLVDVFILMMEGIHEEIYTNKKTFGQAALATIGKYGMPAFAGQLTTILALAPLMAISGTSGKFIRVLPVTTIACLVVAFAVALLISVPLSRLLLGGIANRGAEAQETLSDRAMAAVSRGLERFSLGTTLRNKWIAGFAVLIAVGMFVLSMMAATRIPVTLYPDNDGVNMGINVELPASTTLETSQRIADEVGEILREKPYIESVIKLVGRKSPLAGGSLGASLQPSVADNFTGYSIKLVEREDREHPSYVIANELREELAAHLEANVAGADLLVAAESGGPTTGDPIEVVLTGSDMIELQRLSAQVQAAMKAVPGTSDVRDNLGAVKTEVALIPDREAMDFHGITQSELASQIRFALSNDKIGTFPIPGPEDDLDMHMSLQWASRQGEGGGPTEMSELSTIRAFLQNGDTVAVRALVQPKVSEAPTSIVHKDGDRALTVLSKLEDRALADVLADIQPKLDAMKKDWPAGYAYEIGGESAETAETFGSAGVMLVVALIMVFGVLVIMFGSFAQSFILMATMPLALIGTFLGFYLAGMELSFFAVVGLISLIGIVANNGIVMVDTMNSLLREGASVAEAAAQGAAARLRPILTTSITTVVGLLPLAIGSPMYAPLCYAIIFGLAASTILSLVIVPCLYLLLTGESQRTDPVLD